MTEGVNGYLFVYAKDSDGPPNYSYSYRYLEFVVASFSLPKRKKEMFTKLVLITALPNASAWGWGAVREGGPLTKKSFSCST